MIWRLTIVVLPLLCIVGCVVPHFDALYPEPDYVAVHRASRTFAIDRGPVPREYACTSHVCVRGLREQMERGLSSAFAALASPTDDVQQAQYVARLQELVLRTSISQGRWGPSVVQVSLTYRFALTDTRSGLQVVRLGDTETVTGTGSESWARLFQRVEHDVIRRIEAAVARSPLVDG